jgi:hypothetical protein
MSDEATAEAETPTVKTPAPCSDCNSTGRKPVVHRGTGETHTVTCSCKYELPIRFVWQPDVAGCGVAVIAMVAGLTYSQARQYFTLERDFNAHGMYLNEIHEALNVLGFSYQIFDPNESRIGYTPRTPWPIAAVSDLAIAQVKNLRDAAWHFVVVLRDGRALDPAFGVIQGLYRYPEVTQIIALFKHAS